MAYDTGKQIALCDFLFSGTALLARRVILAFRSLCVYPIELLEIKKRVNDPEDKMWKEGTNNDWNAGVETSHLYVPPFFFYYYYIT